MKHTPPANRGPCPHTTMPVMVSPKPMVLTAGSQGAPAPLHAIRVSLAGHPRPVVEGLPGYAPTIVSIDWPDMGVPAIDPKDWQWIARKLRALHKPIHVNCMAGHGRTGTCLAILGHFFGAMPKGVDPVQWVRDHYCPDAVETNKQIVYIEAITGRVVKVDPKPPRYTAPTVGGFDHRGPVATYTPPTTPTPYTNRGRGIADYPPNPDKPKPTTAADDFIGWPERGK